MDKLDILVKIFRDAQSDDFEDVNHWMRENPEITRFILGYDKELPYKLENTPDDKVKNKSKKSVLVHSNIMKAENHLHTITSFWRKDKFMLKSAYISKIDQAINCLELAKINMLEKPKSTA